VRIGFIGVRFAGLDGVTLESAKLADVLRTAGHEVSWFAGELAAEFTPGVEFVPARFDTAENLALQERCFGVDETSTAVLDEIERRAAQLSAAIEEYVAAESIALLIPQNALAIPMHLPLGIALAGLARRGMPMLAHHHDFAWERERFYPNGVSSILEAAFPPIAPSVQHVVINSLAQQALQERTGATSSILPNVMDFENRPRPGDGDEFRCYAGLGADDTVLLQPTRIIPRKSIELTLELASHVADRAVKVVATHPGLDQGTAYAESLVKRAGDLGVDYRMAPVGGAGQPSLGDAYAAADLVTYPSRSEGFGNALLEANYYGRPLLVNRYPVYVADIAPTGLDVIEIEGAITSATVDLVTSWLGDAARQEAAAERNYEICLAHFSYAAARRCLLPLVR
jgi:glycosyltransferase involved in cell wall biosynthesis